MTILTNVPNGADLLDVRETINAMLADIRTLKLGRFTVTPGTGGSTITFDDVVTRSGDAYTFTARRDHTTSAETHTITLAPSSTAPAATAADFGGAFPSATIDFPVGAATAPVTFTVPATVQPE